MTNQLVPYLPPEDFLEWGWGADNPNGRRRLYKKQWEIVESVLYDNETVVPAGNKLGA